MSIKQATKVVVDLAIAGGMIYGASKLAEFGGSELLSHLENEKITNAALFAIGRGLQDVGGMGALAGKFIAMIIPYTVFQAGKWGVENVAPEVLPRAQSIFEEQVLPVVCELPSWANTTIVQPGLENGKWGLSKAGQAIRDYAPGIIRESGKGIWWVASNTPGAISTAFHDGVVPAVSFAASTTYYIGVGALKIGFNVLWFIGEKGSASLG